MCIFFTFEIHNKNIFLPLTFILKWPWALFMWLWSDWWLLQKFPHNLCKMKITSLNVYRKVVFIWSDIILTLNYWSWPLNNLDLSNKFNWNFKHVKVMFTKDYHDSLHEAAETKNHFVDVSLRMPKCFRIYVPSVSSSARTSVWFILFKKMVQLRLASSSAILKQSILAQRKERAITRKYLICNVRLIKERQNKTKLSVHCFNLRTKG